MHAHQSKSRTQFLSHTHIKTHINPNHAHCQSYPHTVIPTHSHTHTQSQTHARTHPDSQSQSETGEESLPRLIDVETDGARVAMMISSHCYRTKDRALSYAWTHTHTHTHTHTNPNTQFHEHVGTYMQYAHTHTKLRDTGMSTHSQTCVRTHTHRPI